MQNKLIKRTKKILSGLASISHFLLKWINWLLFYHLHL